MQQGPVAEVALGGMPWDLIQSPPKGPWVLSSHTPLGAVVHGVSGALALPYELISVRLNLRRSKVRRGGAMR